MDGAESNQTAMKGNAFFIVGVQRSGTTLLSVLLSKHPDILMEQRSIGFRIVTCFRNLYHLLPFNMQMDENKFLQWLIKNDDKGRLAALIDYENVEQYKTVQDLIEGSISKKLKENDKLLWGDKSPNLQHFTSDLVLLMPHVKFLHIMRDGRANAYSMSKRSYKNLELSAQIWMDGNSEGIVNQNIIGSDNYKILKYEDLLNHPEEELKSVCSFLGLPYAPDMLDLSSGQIEEEKRYVKSYFDVSKIDKWKEQLKGNNLRKVERIQGPLLEKMGYELSENNNILNYRQLSLRRRIFYNQMDNVKQLFRSKSIGMKAQEKVLLRHSLKSRLKKFATAWVRDVMAEPIFKSLFSKYFYKEKYFRNDDS